MRELDSQPKEKEGESEKEGMGDGFGALKNEMRRGQCYRNCSEMQRKDTFPDDTFPDTKTIC